MRRNLLTILMLFLAVQLSGQIVKNNSVKKPKYYKYFSGSMENGIMLSNGSEVGDDLVENSYYGGVDFRLGFRNSDESNPYSVSYRRPYYGVGFTSTTFKNDAIGTPNALYFFLTMPFQFEAERDSRWSFSYTGSFGLSYNFNPYDEESNPINVYIGSYRNCYMHLGLTANYKISDRWQAFGTVGFKHFSNGAFKMPNSGINIIPSTVGVKYRLQKDEVPLYRTETKEFIKHDRVNFNIAVGSKNFDVEDDRNYVKSTIGVHYLKQISYKYRFGGGVDMFITEDGDERVNSSASSFSEKCSFAVVGSCEWMLTSRLCVPMGVGLYINRNSENGERRPYYERVGIKYELFNDISAGVTIKAHDGVADFFEWTLSYSLNRDPNRY